MNESTCAAPTKPRLTVERVLRDALSDPRRRESISEAAGWRDSSSTSSRVLSGQQGLQLDKLDAVLLAAGLTVVTPGYLDWLSKGAVMGANCWCERNSMGACGANW